MYFAISNLKSQLFFYGTTISLSYIYYLIYIIDYQ